MSSQTTMPWVNPDRILDSSSRGVVIPVSKRSEKAKLTRKQLSFVLSRRCVKKAKRTERFPSAPTTQIKTPNTGNSSAKIDVVLDVAFKLPFGLSMCDVFWLAVDIVSINCQLELIQSYPREVSWLFSILASLRPTELTENKNLLIFHNLTAYQQQQRWFPNEGGVLKSRFFKPNVTLTNRDVYLAVHLASTIRTNENRIASLRSVISPVISFPWKAQLPFYNWQALKAKTNEILRHHFLLTSTNLRAWFDFLQRHLFGLFPSRFRAEYLTNGSIKD